jgi:hypothetical protein
MRLPITNEDPDRIAFAVNPERENEENHHQAGSASGEQRQRRLT